MSMSKKDYENIAARLRSLYGSHPKPTLGPSEQKTRIKTLDKVVDELADLMQEDNPRFMKHRFMLAATPSWHQVSRGLAVPGKGRGNAVRLADKVR